MESFPPLESFPLLEWFPLLESFPPFEQFPPFEPSVYFDAAASRRISDASDLTRAESLAPFTSPST